METKRCCHCQKDKLTSDFYGRKDKGIGLSSWCKTCTKERRDKFREKYKENDRAATTLCRERRRRDNTEKIVYYLLEHPCIDCGESNVLVLDFDHNDPQTKKCSVSSLSSTSHKWELVKQEIDKCSVRCANCHRKKTVQQLNHSRYQVIEDMKKEDFVPISQKTFYRVSCRKGHRFTPNNVRYYKGYKICKECESINEERKKKRRYQRSTRQERTHCNKGHEYTEENTFLRSNRKTCRECYKITKENKSIKKSL